MTALPQTLPPPAEGGVVVRKPRIVGLDIARALAILGMVTVHFGFFAADTSTVAGWAYRFPYGRASVLFVTLAGVGVSLLFAARPAQLAWQQILWRAIVFFPLGIVLEQISGLIFVILQYYAAYYLVAGAAAMLRTGPLLTLTGLWSLLGPWLFVVAEGSGLGERVRLDSFADPAAALEALVITGVYPLITWMPSVLVGVLIGRTDLRDSSTQVVLALGGSAVAATAYVLSEIATSIAPSAAVDSGLLIAEGHSGSPLNVAGATGVAVAAIGICLLLGSLLPRLMWPLTAAGQLALSIYVAHIVIFWWTPDALISRAGPGPATFKVLRFFLIATALSVLWRRVAKRGPLEALLALPFDLRRNREPPARPVVPPAQVGGG